MLKKFVVPLVLFLIGIAFYILGALLKVLHWGLGNFNGATLLIIASIIQFIAIVLAIVTLVKIYRN